MSWSRPGDARLQSEPASVEIILTASVAPSEDQEKVIAAAKKILGECRYELERAPTQVRFHSNDVRCLRKIHDQLRDRRVRDAARRFLLRSRDGDALSLLLNRQAASVGIVVLCAGPEDSQLGPLVLQMTSAEADTLMDWLTAH